MGKYLTKGVSGFLRVEVGNGDESEQSKVVIACNNGRSDRQIR